MIEFNETLVCCDLDAADDEMVIQIIAGRMADQGLVCEDYGRRTVARERQHPTGLPTRPYCIAFPHADAEGVQRSALGVASLRNPVVFKSMEDPDESLEVWFVFMLANRLPEEQIDILRSLATLFGQPEKLSELRNQTSPAKITAWLKQELNLG